LQMSTAANRTQRSGVLTVDCPKPLVKPMAMRPGLGLLSVVALLCLSLEAEVLQQIDALRLYLTFREISLEAGFALLVTLGMACAWWLLALLFGRVAATVLREKRLRIRVQWVLWLSLPLVYLIYDLIRDFNLEVLPHWNPTQNANILMSLALLGVCVFGFLRIDSQATQEFCGTRLVPIAWAHIAIATVAAGALYAHGVRLFRDYERPTQAAAVSNSPDIILITLDALRADDTSVYGYSRPTTPNLEKFAQSSFTFDHFFTNASFTNAATSALETGKLPWTERVFQHGGFLRGGNQRETLAAALKQQGYYTGMISSNFFAAPFHHRTLESYDAVRYASSRNLNGLRLRALNWIGIDVQATFTLSLLRGPNALSSYLDGLFQPGIYPFPAEDVFSQATKLLERNHDPRPSFLWAHIYPPHDPFFPPPTYRHRFVPAIAPNYRYMVPEPRKQGPGVPVDQLRDAYDEMILYADHSVGEFLDWLHQTGRFDRSIVIVSADHGELFDHDRLSHVGPDLYNGVISVPLLIHLPGQTQGAHIEQLAQQIDLLPTVLDLVSAPVPGWAEGSSLKSMMKGNSMPERYVFSMNLQRNRIFDPITKGTIAVIDKDFKFVRYLESGQELLFRFKTDPGELHNLADSEPEVAKRMRDVLLNKIQEVNRKPINLR